MPPLSMLIKPSSSNCDLRCKYCFYHSIAQSRDVCSYGLMKPDLLEKLVAKALNFADGSCTFAFQGGEPTFVGLDFYRTLIEMEKKYNKKNITIYNAIQTNGMVIDPEWAQFLHENHFLVGISLDGPKEIHDGNRVDAKGNGSFKKVMETIALFNEYQVEYNVLTVVTSNVARHIRKVYEFFRMNDFRYLQFIPCLDPLNEKPGGYPYSLKPDRYAYFLKTLFDLWVDDMMRGRNVSIRDFDNYVGMVAGIPPESCSMSGQCTCQFVIEADGGVYPCDFYVIDEYYLGHIVDMEFEALASAKVAQRFVNKSIALDERCMQCHWRPLCRGGCRRCREPFDDGKPGLNYFCQSYQDFFTYAYPRLQQLAHTVRNR